MAYKMMLAHDTCRCGARATYEVFTSQDSLLGIFCKQHADKAVRDLKSGEESVEEAKARIGGVYLPRRPKDLRSS